MGIFLAGLIGLILPSDEALYLQDKSWRIVYGAPIAVALMQMLFFIVVFTEEPILFSIAKKEDNKKIIKFLRRIYRMPKGIKGKHQIDETLKEFIAY